MGRVLNAVVESGRGWEDVGGGWKMPWNLSRFTNIFQKNKNFTNFSKNKSPTCHIDIKNKPHTNPKEINDTISAYLKY